MASRALLHRSNVQDFKDWLVKDGWELEEAKGVWEVIRARKVGKKFPLMVYDRSGGDHLSLLDRDIHIVKQFIKDRHRAQG